MTAAVSRRTASLSLPQTQNTAPVLEFDCLYTHDACKKAKKWQDGMLRYHTFNKRVMVYDVSRNFIGDMHWTGGEYVQEGDKLTLERCGVKVEVADCVGRTETDLSGLRKSKNKNPTPSAASISARTAPHPAARPNTAAPARANIQLKHRSLNALMGTPKRLAGKAQLPTKSLFEARHQRVEGQEREQGRPPKRPKTGERWDVTSTTTPTRKVVKPNKVPVCAPASDAAEQKKPVLRAGQQRLAMKEVIALSDDDEFQPPNDFLPGFSDDALANSSSPAKGKQKVVKEHSTTSSSPAFEIQELPDRMNAVSRPSKSTQQPARGEEMSAPTPIVAIFHHTELSNHDTPDKRAAEFGSGRKPDAVRSSEISNTAPAARQRSSPRKQSQTLRLAAKAPRKRGLLCHDQLMKNAKKPTPVGDGHSAETTPSAFVEIEEESRPSAAQLKMQARLARIDKKGGSTSSARLSKTSKKASTRKPQNTETSSDGVRIGDSVTETARGEAANMTLTSYEASAMELRRLDDRMLSPPAPRSRPTPAIDKQSITVSSDPSPPPQRENRSLRRTISESNALFPSKSRRMPSAPLRYTPSPTKSWRKSTPANGTRSATPAPMSDKAAPSALASERYRAKKPFRNSVSLNITVNNTSTVILSKQFKITSVEDDALKELKPLSQDVGPWSRDAFDLFRWRPPGWDEDKWCVKEEGENDGAPVASLSGGVSMPNL